MPVGVKVDIRGDTQVIQALQSLGVVILPTTRREIYNQLLSLRNRVTRMGPRPTYPINWDSEKQKRAYFATKGFRHGIPYRRTGRFSRSWRVVRSGDGYMIENPLEFAVYVGGDADAQGQSNIHRGRWPLWALLLDEYVDKIPPDAERKIEAEARRLGL